MFSAIGRTQDSGAAGENADYLFLSPCEHTAFLSSTYSTPLLWGLRTSSKNELTVPNIAGHYS